MTSPGGRSVDYSTASSLQENIRQHSTQAVSPAEYISSDCPPETTFKPRRLRWSSEVRRLLPQHRQKIVDISNFSELLLHYLVPVEIFITHKITVI